MMCFMLIAVRILWFVFLAKGRIQPKLISVKEPHSFFFSMLYSNISLLKENKIIEN